MHFGSAVENTGDFLARQSFKRACRSPVSAGNGYLTQLLLCNYGNVLLKEGKLLEARGASGRWLFS